MNFILALKSLKDFQQFTDISVNIETIQNYHMGSKIG